MRATARPSTASSRRWTASPREVARGLDRGTLQRAMPAGAARNALDCAFMDLEAKRSRPPGHALPRACAAAAAAHRLHDLARRRPTRMAAAAAAASARPLLKVKLGGEGDVERIAAVRRAAPGAELIVDANEGWSAGESRPPISRPAPPPASRSSSSRCRPPTTRRSPQSRGRSRSAPTRACTTAPRSPRLVGKYDAVNIKLDKTGGLTEALALAAAAEAMGFMLMVGCMIATSLSMAPAMLVAQRARVVDLDGPLLLARDRPRRHSVSRGAPCIRRSRELWG